MARRRRRIIDLSRPIEASMPVFPLYPKPMTLPWTRTPVHAFDSEVLHCVTHTGTHMDAPSHFLKCAGNIDGIDLARCVVPGVVLDLRGIPARGTIDCDSLSYAEGVVGRGLEAGEAVLLWTGGESVGSPPTT